MDLPYLQKIKQLAIISMFSDDELMDTLVLKGGNVLDLIYGVSVRSSIDIDFSMKGEFEEEKLNQIFSRINKILVDTFNEEGLAVFEINFAMKPKQITSELKDFWGGYEIEFKVADKNNFVKFQNDIFSLRRNALVVGPRQRRKFKIEISKFEYCDTKKKQDYDGYTIYLYTPTMIVFEKLRAICQQMPEYKKIVKNKHQTARARDFVDIYCLVDNFKIKFNLEENVELLRNIFEAKKVPIPLINKINEFREFHRQDFPAVVDTVKPGSELKDFDYYFDFVIDLCKDLKSFWKI